MARRKSRLRRKARVGFWKIKKTGALPPQEVIDRLELKPLDYAKYKRVKG